MDRTKTFEISFVGQYGSWGATMQDCIIPEPSPTSMLRTYGSRLKDAGVENSHRALLLSNGISMRAYSLDDPKISYPLSLQRSFKVSDINFKPKDIYCFVQLSNGYPYCNPYSYDLIARSVRPTITVEDLCPSVLVLNTSNMCTYPMTRRKYSVTVPPLLVQNMTRKTIGSPSTFLTRRLK